LRAQVGPERIFVSESGVETAEDVALLNQAQVDAVLVGETLMRAPNKQTALNELTRLI
jgi:indole-3-glycerol phosphate synthase